MPHMPFHQNPYQYDWNTTPSGGRPPASTESPEAFLSDFANTTVTGLSDENRLFLPSENQMQQNIAMARYGLGNQMAGQQLSGQQNLLNMTGGMGLSSLGNDFGARQNALQSGLGNVNQQYQNQLAQSIGGFRGDVLSEQYRYQDALTSAIANIIRSGEGDDIRINPNAPQTELYDYNARAGYLGSGDAPTGVGTGGGAFLEGFPNAQQYQAWLSAGADPNTATSFGFTGPTSILFGLGNQV